MFRIMIALFLMVSVFSIAYSDNSSRMAELKRQQIAAVTQIQQANQFIETKKAEIQRLQGAIDELSLQDKAVKEEKQNPPAE